MVHNLGFVKQKMYSYSIFVSAQRQRFTKVAIHTTTTRLHLLSHQLATTNLQHGICMFANKTKRQTYSQKATSNLMHMQKYLRFFCLSSNLSLIHDQPTYISLAKTSQKFIQTKFKSILAKNKRDYETRQWGCR